MEHIKNTLQGVIKEISEKQSSEKGSIFRLFNQSLTAKERRHVKCGAFCRGVLTVNVDSSAWLYQLSLRKEDLARALGVKDVRLRIGDIK